MLCKRPSWTGCDIYSESELFLMVEYLSGSLVTFFALGLQTSTHYPFLSLPTYNFHLSLEFQGRILSLSM